MTRGRFRCSSLYLTAFVENVSSEFRSVALCATRVSARLELRCPKWRKYLDRDPAFARSTKFSNEPFAGGGMSTRSLTAVMDQFM